MDGRTAPQARAPKLGLALGGGLPFGVAAIGVLDVFEKHGLPIDCLAGTSMGSVIGLLYAYGYTPRELEQHFTDFFKRKRLIPVLLRDLRPSRSGLVQGKQVIRALAGLVAQTTSFEELRIPFAVPATDLLSGQEIVFRSGPVLPAIRASISMPGVFQPVAWGETYLVDGAIISPIPVHLLEPLGADLCIPMRAVRHWPQEVRQRLADTREGGRARTPPTGPPDLIHLVWRSLSVILQDQFAELLLGQYPIHLQPEIPFDYASSPDKVGEIIELGRQETERHVPAIHAALSALEASGPARTAD